MIDVVGVDSFNRPIMLVEEVIKPSHFPSVVGLHERSLYDATHVLTMCKPMPFITTLQTPDGFLIPFRRLC